MASSTPQFNSFQFLLKLLPFLLLFCNNFYCSLLPCWVERLNLNGAQLDSFIIRKRVSNGNILIQFVKILQIIYRKKCYHQQTQNWNWLLKRISHQTCLVVAAFSYLKQNLLTFIFLKRTFLILCKANKFCLEVLPDCVIFWGILRLVCKEVLISSDTSGVKGIRQSSCNILRTSFWVLRSIHTV